MRELLGTCEFSEQKVNIWNCLMMWVALSVIRY
jgi:hypothetical protein